MANLGNPHGGREGKEDIRGTGEERDGGREMEGGWGAEQNLLTVLLLLTVHVLDYNSYCY